MEMIHDENEVCFTLDDYEVMLLHAVAWPWIVELGKPDFNKFQYDEGVSGQ